MNKSRSKNTYGVYNLIEWLARLRMGKATVKVHFSGGSITPQGVTPATYTTEDPIIQFAIERSPDFLSGKIKLVRHVKLNGNIEIGHNDKHISEAFSSVMTDNSSDGNSISNSEATEVANSEETPADEVKSIREDESSSLSDESHLSESAGMVQVEFSGNDEARDYLIDNYNISKSKMRTRADIMEIARSLNVDIKFI